MLPVRSPLICLQIDRQFGRKTHSQQRQAARLIYAMNCSLWVTQLSTTPGSAVGSDGALRVGSVGGYVPDGAALIGGACPIIPPLCGSRRADIQPEDDAIPGPRPFRKRKASQPTEPNSKLAALQGINRGTPQTNFHVAPITGSVGT